MKSAGSIGIAVLGAGDAAAHVLISSLINNKVDDIPAFAVVAVWDSDKNRAHQFANTFSLPLSVCCLRGDDALTRGEVVVAAICGASPATQPTLAAKAIHAGKHVILVPGYPLAINHAQNSDLIEALAAYPSLVCALASGFHYLPAFSRLQRELSSKLASGSVRSISISATTSPQNLFGNYDWQADSASGGGALSQLGAPLLDASLALLLYRAVKDEGELTAATSVTVQGRAAQLLDDSTDHRNVARLWPRTAEDACWLQIDLKKRRNDDNSENNCSSTRKVVFQQSVVSVEIMTCEALDGQDPELNISISTDCSLRFKTDGKQLWLLDKSSRWTPLSLDSHESSISDCGGDNGSRKGLLMESIQHFANLVSSELHLVSAKLPHDCQLDGGALFSSVLKNLVKSQSIVDVNVALATQKLIDSIRTSLLDCCAVTLASDDKAGGNNLISWSHCL